MFNLCCWFRLKTRLTSIVIFTAFDDVYILDTDYTDRYDADESAYVIQYTNHTFQCVAINTNQGTDVSWDIQDTGGLWTRLDDDTGFPRTELNGTKYNRRGQVCSLYYTSHSCFQAEPTTKVFVT